MSGVSFLPSALLRASLFLALLAPLAAQIATDGTVKNFQKISDTAGNFTATLDSSDNFGRSMAALGDLDSDGVPDLAVGAWFDDDGGTNRGAVYVLFMNSDGTVKSFQKISGTVGGFTAPLADADYFGASVAALGDLDGDGVTDLAVGAQYDDDGGLNRGAVYVLFMNANGTVKSYQTISDTTGGFTATLDNADYFGCSVAAPGDLDGDTVPDLVVGAHDDDDGGPARGAVYVLFMNINGTVKSHQTISDTAGGFTAPLADYDLFGISVAALGDLDGDGVTDLAVGASYDDDGGTERGAVYVLLMNTNGTVKSYQKISATAGNFTALLTDYDRFGGSVTATGDLDGDGVNDLAVGAMYDDDGRGNAGAVYVLFMNADGTVKAFQKISGTAGNFTATLDNSDFFGMSGAAPGDLDGDGVADLVVGALYDDDGGTDRGAVYVLFLQEVPAIPTSLSATPGPDAAGKITLGWSANSEADLSHYVVYQSTTQGFSPTSGDSLARVDKPDTTLAITTGLSAGTTYYYRIAAVDSAGNYSGYSAEAGSETIPLLVKLEYFIDTDLGFGAGTDVTPLTQAITFDTTFVADLSALSSGFHTLFVRAKDELGEWSLPNTRPFYIGNNELGAAANITKAEYFIDTDPGFGLGNTITITINSTIDASFVAVLDTVSAGFHTLYVRVKDANGEWSLPNTRPFYLDAAMQATAPYIESINYYFTGTGYTPSTTAYSGFTADSIIDVEFLTVSDLNLEVDSTYLFHVYARDANGLTG
ncbi:MAG: hypothetical protein V3W14_10765, partial [Candidatus Neomarinimicrobiota bacterium]